jgi:hypothetical protein
MPIYIPKPYSSEDALSSQRNVEDVPFKFDFQCREPFFNRGCVNSDNY